MLNSLAELIIISLIISWILRSVKIPELIGLLVVGIIFGPYVLNILNPELLDISGELRLAALIIILLRAGFELNKNTLQKVGKQALLLSFIPAIFEASLITILAPALTGLTYLEGAILGTILAAVSPAVVVPFMIRFIEEKRGTNKGIPTMMVAASSIDDVFVIVVYSILIGIYTGKHTNILWKVAGIPISIVVGIAIGIGVGIILYKIFDRFNPRATKRVLIIMAVSIILIQLEHFLEQWIPFSALLAIMAIGFIILEKRENYAHELSLKLAKIWIIAEIVLFTLVGAKVNVTIALHSGLTGAALIFAGLIARSAGTWICLYKTNLNIKERFFVVIAYIPKATVQAAIGAAPLAAMKIAGIDSQPGEIILAIAVLSILITAPLGAWGISYTGKKWLVKEKSD